jgi:hypothetical protein
MAPRKSFLLRLDPATHEALEHWADADLRSLNAQIEFLLRRALQESGRLKRGEAPAAPDGAPAAPHAAPAAPDAAPAAPHAGPAAPHAAPPGEE